MARRGVHLDEKSIALVLDSYDDRAARFFYTLLFVILEPAGWFFFWEGLGKIFLVPKEKISDYRFYRRMANAEIGFSDY